MVLQVSLGLFLIQEKTPIWILFVCNKKSIEELINQEGYYVYDDNTVYYFDYRLGNEDKANKSPYGYWLSAYVVVTYDGKNNHFYWTGIDSAGYTIDLQKEVKKLTRKDIYQVTYY